MMFAGSSYEANIRKHKDHGLVVEGSPEPALFGYSSFAEGLGV